jgi:hypothetical protein
LCLQDFTRAEALFVRAKKPELAVKAFKDAGRWQVRIRVRFSVRVRFRVKDAGRWRVRYG